ncbi:MAG: bifunctional tetrahydrofolate synthase/dihydrofolate synthase, partial [Chromatocurvus sp.]
MTETPDLKAWLDYLEKLHPRKIDLGLERLSTVAGRLELLPLDVPVITVAGTNGKGTVVRCAT